MSYTALPEADLDADTPHEKGLSIETVRSSIRDSQQGDSICIPSLKHEEDVEYHDMVHSFVIDRECPSMRNLRFRTWMQEFLQTLHTKLQELRQTEIHISLFFLAIASSILLILLPILLVGLYIIIGRHSPHLNSSLDHTLAHNGDPASTYFPTIEGSLDDLGSINKHFDPAPLQNLCAKNKWQPGLHVGHYNPVLIGGPSNIRSVFVNGLRFAIEAGAIAYVMPRIVPRSVTNLGQWQPNVERDFSYFFDRDYFKDTFSLACPQIKIYDDVDAIREYDWAPKEPPLLHLKQLNPALYMKHLLTQPQIWRGEFDKYLNSLTGNLSASNPIYIEFFDTFLAWPILYDPPDIVMTLARPFRSPAHVRKVAVAVLTSLKTRFALDFNVAKGAISTATPPPNPSSSYFGCHLRTEQDTVGGSFPPYQSQADTFLTLAHQGGNGYKVIYLASGDIDEVERFRHQAQPYNMTVVTKLDLLTGTDREALRSLSWDQQGLVDYEILLRAGFFAGVGASSFSYKIAVKRHGVLMEGEEEGRDWTPMERGGPTWWSAGGEYARYGPGDKLSMVLKGSNVPLFGYTLWP